MDSAICNSCCWEYRFKPDFIHLRSVTKFEGHFTNSSKNTSNPIKTHSPLIVSNPKTVKQSSLEWTPSLPWGWAQSFHLVTPWRTPMDGWYQLYRPYTHEVTTCHICPLFMYMYVVRVRCFCCRSIIYVGQDFPAAATAAGQTRNTLWWQRTRNGRLSRPSSS